MKIGRVTVSVHRVPVVLPLLDRPTGDGLRVLCEVETEDGLVGQGMTGKFLGHGVAAIVEHYLAPAVKGMDPRDLEAIHARLTPLVSERGHMSGINLSALACVDLALWDLIGKASGRTVAQLLGGHSDHADVYVTFGFGAYDKDQLFEVAKALIAKGHKRLKILVGVSPDGPKGDAERVRHVRDAIGDDIMLAMDANESITLDVATDIARRVEAVRYRLVRGSGHEQRPARSRDAAPSHDAFHFLQARWTAIPSALEAGSSMMRSTSSCPTACIMAA